MKQLSTSVNEAEDEVQTIFLKYVEFWINSVDFEETLRSYGVTGDKANKLSVCATLRQCSIKTLEQHNLTDP